MATKTPAIVLLLGVVAVVNVIIAGIAVYKPMTTNGTNDNTQRRKADNIREAIETYKECVKNRGGGTTISIQSFVGAPKVQLSEPYQDCEGTQRETLRAINSL